MKYQNQECKKYSRNILTVHKLQFSLDIFS